MMDNVSSNSVSPGGSSSLSPDSSPLSVICPNSGGSPNPRVSSSGLSMGLESPDSFVSSASSIGRGKTRGGGKAELKCAVCGDKALGHNFDAITCESCKAFFRRNATKGEVRKLSVSLSLPLVFYLPKFLSRHEKLRDILSMRYCLCDST